MDKKILILLLWHSLTLLFSDWYLFTLCVCISGCKSTQGAFASVFCMCVCVCFLSDLVLSGCGTVWRILAILVEFLSKSSPAPEAHAQKHFASELSDGTPQNHKPSLPNFRLLHRQKQKERMACQWREDRVHQYTVHCHLFKETFENKYKCLENIWSCTWSATEIVL